MDGISIQIGISPGTNTDSGSLVHDENVDPNESYAIVILPEEFKAEDAKKEIEAELMDVKQELYSGDASVIDIKPQVGLDDTECYDQKGLIDIRSQVGEIHVQASREEEPVELGLALPVSHRKQTLGEYVESKATSAIEVQAGPLLEPESSEVIMVIKPDVGEVVEAIEVGGEETDEEEIIDVCSVWSNDEDTEPPSEISGNVSQRSNIENDHSQHAGHFCPICNKLFSTESACKEHKVCHSKKKDIPCPMCPLRFLDEEELTCHTKVHSEDPQHHCGFCGMHFTTYLRLQGHCILKHRRADKPRYTKNGYCSSCGKTYITEKGLSMHSCKGNFVSRPYPCRVCPRKFKFRDKRDAHMQTHDGERNVACELCGEYFSCVYDREKHVSKQHPKAKWKKCSECDMFLKYAHFQKHMKRHAEKKKMDKSKHECEVCGMKHKLKEYMDIHMAEKHGGPLPRKCKECGERFLTLVQMNNHKKEKHFEAKKKVPVTQRRNYQCQQCSRAFFKPKQLKQHMKHHTKIVVRPFKCDFCDSTFMREDGIRGKVHHTWKKHGGPKPHSCKQCGEGFTAKVEMVKHIKALHGPQHETGMGTSTPTTSGF